MILHSLLKRQLKKHLVHPNCIPPEWQNLIKAVNDAYWQSDADRSMLERSLDLSSQELLQANSELRTIFQAFPDLLYRLDNQGTILDCKAGSTDDLYIPLEKLIGKKIHDVPLDIIGGKLFRAIHQVQENRSMVSIEYAMKIKGQKNYYEARLLPVLEDQIIVIVRNITEQKKSQIALLESESKLNQSVAELSAIINTLPGMVSVIDPDYNILLANRDIMERYGHSHPEEVIGKKCYAVRKGRDDICPECGVKLALETGETSVRFSTPQEQNMTGISTKAYVSPIKNDEGVVWSAVEVIMDISDLRQAEEELILLATAIEQASESVIIADREGMIRYTNPAFETLSGFTRKELIGQNYSAFMSDRYDDKFYEKMWNIISKGKVWSGRTTNRMEDGTLREFETRVSPVRDSFGEIVNFVSVNRDITREIALEAKLQRAQKMEALGLLAGGVAHDLNNVLSGIVSYPDLLLMDLPQDSPFINPILTIKRSGEKAAQIVQDLLTLARRGVTNREILNLNDVIWDYLNSPEYLKLIAYYPDVSFETDLENNLLNIKGSLVHLKKTIMNLISNAAEAQPSGGKIKISTSNSYVDIPLKGYEDIREGDFVVLDVTDSGIGIAAEDLNRIFEPFYSKKVLGRSGTGLGMAVVWGTVQDHHGYISVESIEGKGTTFKLYFPVTREKPERRKDLVPIDTYIGRGNTILVVDDVKEQREIAATMLNRLNYTVNTVSSGEKAVEYMKDNSADLLVIDMIMDPGIDGLETYKRITLLHPKQKAIIASGFSETDRVKEAQRLGAGQYIKKPYTLEKLGIAIRDELNK
jgi:PAS domain S-box-containing protein